MPKSNDSEDDNNFPPPALVEEPSALNPDIVINDTTEPPQTSHQHPIPNEAENQPDFSTNPQNDDNNEPPPQPQVARKHKKSKKPNAEHGDNIENLPFTMEDLENLDDPKTMALVQEHINSEHSDEVLEEDPEIEIPDVLNATMESIPFESLSMIEDHHGKVRRSEAHGDVTEIEATLGNLVLYDAKGAPYVDINKLIYRKEKVRKRKKIVEVPVKSYLPDVIYILAKLTVIMISAGFLLVGLSLVTFSSSINSLFINKPIPTTPSPTPVSPTKVSLINPGFSAPKYFEKKDKDDRVVSWEFKMVTVSVETLGLCLITLSVANLINSVVGIHAVVHYYRHILVTSLILEAMVIPELVLGGLTTVHAKCNKTQVAEIRNRLVSYIHTYATEPKMEENRPQFRFASIQLDEIQITLSCCGVTSWVNYLDPLIVSYHDPISPPSPPMNHTTTTTTTTTTTPGPTAKPSGPDPGDRHRKVDLSGIELVIPGSCCRPWWVKNIHCAVGAHLLANPAATKQQTVQFRDRINQEGCLPKIIQMCERMVYLMGKAHLIMASIHLLAVIAEAGAVVTILRKILKLIRIKKTLAKKEAAAHNGDDLYLSDSDETSESQSNVTLTATDADAKSIASIRKKTLQRRKSKIANKNVPMPTENQIHLIKARTDFNVFEANVKNTHVGKWMETARKAIHTDKLSESYGTMELSKL